MTVMTDDHFLIGLLALWTVFWYYLGHYRGWCLRRNIESAIRTRLTELLKESSR